MKTVSPALKPSDFVHLHNHTQYSLLDGLTKVPALVDRIKQLNMDSVAITDHGTMSGAVEFYKTARAGGIKPIIGMEAYVSPRAHTDKDPNHDRQYYHLTLLAMDNTGYQNLMKLSSIASLEGFYYRPRVDRNLLKKYNQGLIVLSGCIGGELSDALRQEQYEIAKKTAAWYKAIFKDRYYIELQDHGHPRHPTAWDEQTKVNRQLLKLASEMKIPAVVTCDAHYLMPEDQQAHEILLCVQTGAFLSDEQRFSLKEFELYVADPKDIIKRWGKTNPDLISNTAKIAERCNVELELGKILIPKYRLTKGETEKALLHKLVWQGLAYRYAGLPRDESLKLSAAQAKQKLKPQIIKRAESELDVIDKVGFNGFFLIVNDFVNWGKDRGIVFGPGRGSTAGSIIAYGLRITDISPLDYDLLFERFLTPERISMPDMDIDIQDSRRDEVINYCIERYGRERVANIVTFGRMAARNSVRDVARVLQVPYAEADRLAKMIPPPVQGRHIPLEKSLKQNSELKTEYETNEQSRRVFELAMKLEGTIRSHGVHAAGVIIAPDDLVKFVPMEMAQKGVIATQYSMGPVEDIGLLKIDFLGLSNLTIINNALRIVKKVYSDSIDISAVALDDGKTFNLLQRGETTGIFQLESAGMRRYLKQLKPTVFDDIIAMVALYRPGPLAAGLTDSFIARKHGLEKVKYDHELMRPALENTYGVMVYQEQFMQIAKEMCGFSGSEADTLRQAVGKKKRDLMVKMKGKIIKGAMAKGVERRVAEKFWSDLEGFADYAFNKSHAACYGLIAYETAYLKANYPDAYMAALMTSDFDNIDRLAIEITECQKMGIEVQPPDINQSFHEFSVIPGESKIRFGLDAVKNVGHGAVDEILRARAEAGGKFQDLSDYCKFVNCRIVNRKALESLAKSGAFDSFAERGLLVNNIDNILALSNRLQKEASAGQVDLFGDGIVQSMAPKLELQNTGEQISPAIQLAWERELLGIYLSSHPLEAYKTFLEAKTVPIPSLNSSHDGRVLWVGGSISQIREISTKSGSKMAFVKMADLTGETELIVFPKIYAQTLDLWRVDNVVLAKGKVDFSRNDELKVLVEEVRLVELEQAGNFKKNSRNSRGETMDNNSGLKQRLYIRLQDSQNQPQLLTLKEKLDGFAGETEVVLVTGEQNSRQIIKLPQTININEESLRELALIFGSMNVVVR